MNEKPSKRLLIAGLLLVLSSVIPFGMPFIAAQASAPEAPGSLISGKIAVAVISGVAEQYPAVVQCSSNQYLVVYERSGDIYGQRLYQDGSLLGDAFVIYDEYRNASDPAVACDWDDLSGNIVVVFTYDYFGDGSDFDVRGQLVHGSHQLAPNSQLIGNSFVVSEDSSGIDETHPAVTCNSWLNSCLVVFESSGSGNGDIWGQRMKIYFNSAAQEGDRFLVSKSALKMDMFPDVVWNADESRFTVMWQSEQDILSGRFRITFVHVYDSEQGPSAEEVASSQYMLFSPNSGEYGYDAQHTYPSLAYDPYNGRYLAGFMIDDGDYTALFAMLFTSDMSLSQLQIIDSLAYDRPAVAFSGDVCPSTGGSGRAEFMIARTTARAFPSYQVYGAILPDMFTASELWYFKENIATVPDAAGKFFNPDVTGSFFSGDYLVVWEERSYTGSEHNIYGQLVSHLAYLYLPILRR